MSTAQHVLAAIDRVRAEALAQFGWTWIELEVASVERDGVVLCGTVAARGLIDRVRQACGADVVLDVRGIAVLTTGRFVEIGAAGIELHRRPDRHELATQIDAADGPVECLTVLGAATLVRACDGTVGWTAGPLGADAPPPKLQPPPRVGVDAIGEAWQTWLDAPYRLGGTRQAGVDCSGLVQRLLGGAGLRLPRHSTDQLAIDPQIGKAGPLGTIVAIWADHEAPCHVGVATGDGRIVHASRSRARVVVEPEGAFVTGTRRVAHVPLDSVIALQHRAAGRFDLLAVLLD